MDFIRYGSLTPQKHEIEIDSFHSAPTKYGIYAFPRGYEEPFLLSGVGRGSIKNGRYRFLRDDNGKKIEAVYTDVFDTDLKCIKEPYASLARKRGATYKTLNPYIPDNIEDDGILLDSFELEDLVSGIFSDVKLTYVYENKPTKFKYSGNIWHHLDTFGDKIIIPDAYIIKRSASRHWVLTDIKTYEKALKKYTKMVKYNIRNSYDDNKWLYIDSIPMDYFSKDEFEVFIEKVS